MIASVTDWYLLPRALHHINTLVIVIAIVSINDNIDLFAFTLSPMLGGVHPH